MAEAKILDGKAIARQIRDEVADGTAALVAAGLNPPGLGVVLVGDNPASQSYVRAKTKACAEAGLHSLQIDLPASSTQQEVENAVQRLNLDPKIHGILVQFPLPGDLSEQSVINIIDPQKDVDGLHPINAGRLSAGVEGFVPCTPAGVQQILIRSGIETSGALAVIIGRSNLVGRPLSLLLSAKGRGGDATVVMCHSRTRDLAAVCRQADILIAAIGKPEFVTADMVRPGATVIDVGINRIDDAKHPKGYRLVGDVAYDEVAKVAGAITPVPGGVGPLTIAMLLNNTLRSARLHQGARKG